MRLGGSIYYTDTDSIITDYKLPPEALNDDLGGLKLEHTIDRAWFLAPKIYMIIDLDGNKHVKFKGVSHKQSSALTEGWFLANLTRSREISLFLHVPIRKQFKNLHIVRYFKEFHVNIYKGEFKDSMINANTLMSGVKRLKIFNSDGLWVDTKPIHLHEVDL